MVDESNGQGESRATSRQPPLTGRRVRLRSIFPSDYDYLYALATSEDMGYRWRFRGMSPSPEAFPQGLWHQVLAQFIIERVENGQRLGLVVAFDANERNGWCHIAMLLDPNVAGTGWVLEAGALFVNYLFTLWNFRKLYAEVLEFNYRSFSSGGGGRFFHEEGRLKDHEFYAGRYWDLLLIALYRDDWEHRPRVFRKLLASLRDPH
jgi:RimJ/RimL family protein N-acetyltransferase